MSWMPTAEPTCEAPAEDDGLELIIQPRTRDLGGFSVARVLPSIERKTVGPFIFFDHMPPMDLAPGQGMDVRPHPHIALATVTYLFDGEFVHRDSLGSHAIVRPGDINWMTAGRGIVHSERMDPERRAQGGTRSHGIQLWVALPQAFEETEPAFHHHDQSELPVIQDEGLIARILIGEAYGLVSPVRTFSPMFYIDVEAKAGARIELPQEYAERSLYLVSGSVRTQGQVFSGTQMLLFKADKRVTIHAESDARFVLLGGAPLDGRRFIWWNFISSSKERIEQAKKDWKEGRFPKVPGDEVDFIPLPDYS